MVLSCLFFIDKVKAGKINNMPLLVAYPIFLSFTMYLYGNLIQTTSSFLVYAFIMMSLSVMFMITAWLKRELNDINKNTFKSIFPIILIWLCIVPLNVLSLKILAVEFVTIIKRVCQILVGVLLDKHFKNDSLVPLKDKIIIFIIIIITMLLYFYR